MKVPFVDLTSQHLPIIKDIRAATDRVVETTDFILGKDVSDFEGQFARYCGTQFAIGVDSGTSALELALRAVDIGSGDEVITVANTFIATASAIAFTGARPIFVDIDKETYNISIDGIRAAISPKTKAIIPVHLYGQPADMDPILELAREHHLKVIEDACQAHGAQYKGRRVGSMGDAGCFSFYPAKNLGAFGDGGIVVTNNPDMADRIGMLRNYGQREKYDHRFIAYNRRLDTLQAAVLRIKLRHLDEWNDARRSHAYLYNEMLSGKDLILPVEAEYAHHVYHLYVVRTEKRDNLQAYLTDKGIATGIHYPIPIHLQNAYQYLGYGMGGFPRTEETSNQILSLPMFPGMNHDQVEYVAETIGQFYG
ncbi:MAG: DegT/DnrJ/EryC1/StrS family aminotransferase [Deltaproteobacteria bacterium]|nr:DegT/DnrJ/EryC1/StrS family aminotransferase [Deltaproteobacteria bacterium]